MLTVSPLLLVFDKVPDFNNIGIESVYVVGQLLDGGDDTPETVLDF